MPQPYFVPVSPISSRKTPSRGLSGSVSSDVLLPFRMKLTFFIAGFFLLRTASAVLQPVSNLAHKFVMSKRRRASAFAGIPSPQHQRISTNVMNQLLCSQSAVLLWVLELKTELRRRSSLKDHRRLCRRQMPTR